MAGPLKSVIQQDVSKGMNAVTNPYDIGQQQSIYLQNLILDEHGSLRTRDGWTLQTISPDLAPVIRPIVKLFDFVQDATGGGGAAPGPGGGTGVVPIVVITSPKNNDVISPPRTISILVTATPAAGLTIASVSFFRDGSLVVTETDAPYSLSVDLTTAPIAVPTTFTASATDSAGNTNTSTAVTVTPEP